MKKVIGIKCSGRKNSNSGFLLDIALDFLQSEGFETSSIFLMDKKILPCTGCEACNKTGECILTDDMELLMEEVLTADLIIFSSPIYFYSLPGHAKIFIDRFQPYWAGKTFLGKELKKHIGGAFISIAGTSGKKSFDCIRLSLKYAMQTINGKLYENNLTFLDWDRKPLEITDDMKKKTLDFAQNLIKFTYEL